MDIREINGLWCDDITFCQEKCDMRDCPRNQCNIRDHNIPHSFSVERPKDCPKEKVMPDREKVLDGLERLRFFNQRAGRELWSDKPMEIQEQDIASADEIYADAIELLKERELPTELKQKMWNALYAKEDEYEKKLVGTDKHHEWFSTYRPWLQMGFNIAIDVIAEWEGR